MADSPAGSGDGCRRSVPRSARLALLVGILSGLSTVVFAPFVSPAQVMLASDVYYYAADALLAGGDIYEVTPPDRPGFRYIYPPVVILTFVPHALLGSPLAAFLVQTVLNVSFAAGIAVVCWRALVRRGVALTRLDAVFLCGFAALSSYSAITVVNGQVTLWLACCVSVGLDALDRNKETQAGIVFALAALVKLFPAALGVWLLRNRASRGVATAVVTGVAGLGAGVLLFGPDLTVTFVADVLTDRYDGFEGVSAPTQTRGGAQRQVAALTGLGPPYVTPVAGAILAPILGYLYLDIDGENRRQAAILGTLLVTLLFFPLQRLYMPLFIFPLVLLLYRLPAGRARTVLLAGTLVSFGRLEFGLVEQLLTGVVPAAIDTPVLSLIEHVFGTILPPTLGMWLLLASCVLVHRA